MAKAKPGRKRRHPLMINAKAWDRQAVMDVLCNRMASSSKGMATLLAQGCEGHDMPDVATIMRWLSEPGENGAESPLYQQYLMAKQFQADWMGEELAELHEKAWVPAFDDEGNLARDGKGDVVMMVDKSSAALVRLEADNKKWLMGKLRPKRFADKTSTELTGPGGGAVQINSTVRMVHAPPVPDDET